MHQQVNGATDNVAIAIEIAKHFGSVYYDSNLDKAARVEYNIACIYMSVYPIIGHKIQTQYTTSTTFFPYYTSGIRTYSYVHLSETGRGE